MQPKTTVKFDAKSFERHKESIKALAQTRRLRKIDASYAAPLPLDIGMQVTRRCNLRCKTCFLWNEKGDFNYLGEEDKKAELDASIIEKVLYETEKAKSRLYMWGAEPLLHKEWNSIAKMLIKEPRWLTICTNGILLDKKIDTLLPISENLAVVISLDGFENEHDAVRGKGMFAKTIKNAELIRSLQKKGEYKGKLTFHCVLNDDIIPNLLEFAEYCDSFGVDSLYFGFPWYISKETCNEMDQYYSHNFDWLNNLEDRQVTSWSTYSYHIKPEMIPILKEQMIKIIDRVFKVRIRLQPPLEIPEFENYLVGKKMPVSYSKNCFAVSNRMDILANGDVTTCQPFREFVVGNLYRNSLIEIWRGEKFNKVRKTISQGLTPICSKCILLYLNGK
jgi:sulfatase maturation enzyme AslB (radical SAM superfamily)